MFERRLFTVVTARNGADALQRLQAQQFDIVLMDIQVDVVFGRVLNYITPHFRIELHLIALRYISLRCAD